MIIVNLFVLVAHYIDHIVVNLLASRSQLARSSHKIM